MPCDSSHMEPTNLEKSTSDVLYLRDDLNGIPLPENWDGGYHPKAYCKTGLEELRDEVTRELCRRLCLLSDDAVRELSLELQMWWRDHKKADADRLERELAEKRDAAERQAAIAKLTPHERKLLGLEDGK